MTRFIYYVFGEDGGVRYVGCSASPKKRLKQHRHTARLRSEGRATIISAFHQWLNRQRVTGRAVYVCTVRRTGDDWRTDEQREIACLADAGVALLNTERSESDRVEHVHTGEDWCSEDDARPDRLTCDIRLPVDDDEHAEIKRRAGKAGITAYVRELLGLPPRKAGRPWPAKPKPK